MRTKGAILWQPGEQWIVEDIDVDDPIAGEVQVQMEAAGMCHSDHHIVTGATPMLSYPVIGGHEGAGIVTKVGPEVHGLNEGDHVVLSFLPACGKCVACVNDQMAMCELGAGLLSGRAISDGNYRVHARGQDVSPMCLLGTFAPYVTVHENSVVKIDDDIPFPVAAISGCGVPTGYCSATIMADTHPGDTIVVIGAGGVGMSAVQGAALAGASRVIAIDPVGYKRDQALKFGATDVFGSTHEAIEPLSTMTGGLMADKTIITVGEMHGDFIEEALILTGKGGIVVVTAMGKLSDGDAKLNCFIFAMMSKQIRGTIFGGGNPRRDIPRILSLYKQGQLNLDDMITTHYTLEQVNQGYADMLDGTNIRGVITFSGADR